MDGLILCGGKGSRLRPLTYTSAKQPVPVANKPVLFYGVEALVNAGIAESAIVGGEAQGESRAAVGGGSKWGAQVTYIPQDAPRGLAHAVLIAQDFVGDDPFVMCLDDNLLNRGIIEFVEQFVKERPAAQTLLKPVPDPQMFGVAEGREGDRLLPRAAYVDRQGRRDQQVRDRAQHRARGRVGSRPGDPGLRQPDRPWREGSSAAVEAVGAPVMLGDNSEVWIKW